VQRESQRKETTAMAHYLIWMSPEPGHIIPTIKVARDLTRAGHTVTYQAPGALGCDLSKLGFSTIGFFDDLCGSVNISMHKSTKSVLAYFSPINARYPGADVTRAVRCELLAAVESVGADLLIVDGAYDAIFGLKMHLHLPSCCALGRVYTHLPYYPIHPDEFAPARGPLIFLSPREFEISSLRYREAFYSEASFVDIEDASEFDWSAIDRSRPIIYCSLGSQSARYSHSLSCLCAIGAAASTVREYFFVINAGRYAKVLKNHLDEENVAVFDWVPGSGMLAQSVVMITHGGFGSIKSAIRHRVPILALPQAWDQPMNAKRVIHHGIGMAIDKTELRPEYIATSVRTLVTDSAFARNVSTMNAIFVNSDRNRATATILEGALA
jgi:UDP:flavonoid glycosyltransferase YjiC (YdhE family)